MLPCLHSMFVNEVNLYKQVKLSCSSSTFVKTTAFQNFEYYQHTHRKYNSFPTETSHFLLKNLFNVNDRLRKISIPRQNSQQRTESKI